MTNMLYKKFHISTDLTSQTSNGFTSAIHKPLASLTYQDQQLIFEQSDLSLTTRVGNSCQDSERTGQQEPICMLY